LNEGKTMQRKISLDIPALSPDEVNSLLKSRCEAEPIVPDLVTESEVSVPDAYNRFRDLEKKQAYRDKMLAALSQQFSKDYGHDAAEKMMTQFMQLAAMMETNGAAIFGNMINTEAFKALIDAYQNKLSTDGSKSWIHSYINMGNHPDFLTNEKFNGALAHPLLIALISYGAGGPIRMVDARGKDAEPLAVQAQDNMLHIDNTPFRKEYKIILTWERGKPSGPKGQNFVFIPGTHKGVRNSKVDAEGKAWSTEDGSIFTSKEAVQAVFNQQSKTLGTSTPLVVEATHPDMSLTTVFEAGALVHHRYRTKEKDVPRSCVISAYHRAEDNPGQFLSEEHLSKVAKPGSLMHLMMGKHSDNSEEKFINALLDATPDLANKMNEIMGQTEGAKLVPYSARTLSESELETWKKTVTSAPTVEAIKIREQFFKVGDTLTLELMAKMIKFDKHGPLDLILYGDGHEEIRKWARNRIREMPASRLEERIQKFAAWDLLQAPSVESVMTLDALKKTADSLGEYIDKLEPEIKLNAYLDPKEKISQRDAFRSMRQLIDDLGEAIVRCTSRQTFLSTSLFLCWASDELGRLVYGPDKKPDAALMAITSKLLDNYVSTYVVIEKQIRAEAKLVDDKTTTQQSGLFAVKKEVPVASSPEAVKNTPK
jgi:hypothetical protein